MTCPSHQDCAYSQPLRATTTACSTWAAGAYYELFCCLGILLFVAFAVFVAPAIVAQMQLLDALPAVLASSVEFVALGVAVAFGVVIARCCCGCGAAPKKTKTPADDSSSDDDDDDDDS